MTWLGANRDVRLLQEALEAKDAEIARLRAETKHDHDGNGCHACGRGIMRRRPK
jgi:hypothetical protein